MKKALIIILFLILAFAIYMAIRRKKINVKAPATDPPKIADPAISDIKDLTGLKKNTFPLFLGVRSREVAIYQVHLNEMYRNSGETKRIQVDGVWGVNTHAASLQLLGLTYMDMMTYHISVKQHEKELIHLANIRYNARISEK